MTKVTYLHHNMTGAPSLDASPGGLMAVLDACLITGFNLVAPDEIRYDSATGTCTLTYASGHGYEKHQIIQVSGADQPEYNGRHQVESVTQTTLTFKPDAAPTAAVATGAIECRAAPLPDWEKPVDDGAGTKGAFRSKAVGATGFHLYVDDSNTYTGRGGWDKNGANALWIGAETVADPDTPVDLFGVDVDGNHREYGWLRKGKSTGTVGAQWHLVGDDKRFFLLVDHRPGENRWVHSLYGFGDFIPAMPGSAYHAFVLTGSNGFYSHSAVSAGLAQAPLGSDSNQYGSETARDYAGLKNPQRIFWGWIGIDNYQLAPGRNQTGQVPNVADGRLWYQSRPIMREYGSRAIVGWMPGVLGPQHTRPFDNGYKLETSTGDVLLHLLVPGFAGADAETEFGMVAFSLKQDWG